MSKQSRFIKRKKKADQKIDQRLVDLVTELREQMNAKD